MAKRRMLSGVAHDIAHHAASGFSCLSPHFAQALREASLGTAFVELLDQQPYLQAVVDMLPLRMALESLQGTALGILNKYGFEASDVLSVGLHGTPAPWDVTGLTLHTRTVITASNGQQFESGWL